MDTTAPFRVRRVLSGVVVGLVLVALGFYGWVQYRQSQYNQRARAVVSRYHAQYTLCITAGNNAQLCAGRVTDACVRDPFWRVSKPFASDPTAALPDAGKQCRGATP